MSDRTNTQTRSLPIDPLPRQELSLPPLVTLKHCFGSETVVPRLPEDTRMSNMFAKLDFRHANG